MAIDLKQFSGVMNTDDAPENIGSVHHKLAYNGRFRGNGVNMRFESVEGTTEIVYAMPDGDNECIGSYYDGLRQRIIWANCNSNGYNGWYIYDIKTAVVSPLLVSFINSVTDIFNFDKNYPIASINILYTTEDDGDIIHWTARNNRPMKLNIKDALNNIYNNTWLTDYLTVARQVSIPPIVVSYQDDALVNINNLRSSLYQFRYRLRNRDNTLSTYSSYSKITSPVNPDDLASDVDPTKNNNILLTIPDSGNADVTKIEIVARVLIANDIFSGDLLIKVIDKEAESIGDNSSVDYRFYNDSSYPPTDIQESLQLFDYVPDIANTQELLNGNVIIYGGITIGYDKDTVLDVEASTSLFLNGDAGVGLTITKIYHHEEVYNDDVYLYDLDSYDFILAGDPKTGDKVTISVTYDGVTTDYEYTVLPGGTIADIIAYYISLGLPEIAGSDATTLFGATIQVYPGSFFGMGYAIVYGTPPDAFDISIACWRPLSRYGFGLVYFDEFGKTNGVLTTDVMNIITEEIDTTGSTQPQNTLITFNVNHQPPIWAKYFSWVRAENLTAKSSFYFVSSGTNKDTTTGYAYLDITAFNTNTNNYPAYDFSKGDRIRLVGKYGDVVNVLDVPLIGLVTGEKIQNSAVTLTGQWLKVPYDAAYMVNFGTGGNNNWYCEVYTPVLNSEESQLVFYEFGESYNVINWGTENRYHEGNVQNQTAIQPAIFNFARGDYYIRQRNQPITDDLQTTALIWIIDESLSDKYLSKITNIGRAFVIDDYAKKTFYSTQSRWSLDYQQNTNINQTNRFFYLNFDEIDREKGDIQMFKVWARQLLVFQNRAVGQYGIYSQFISNNSGQSELIKTNDIITVNNINYYQGDHGVGDQYTSVVAGTNQFYFVDPVTGYQIRLGRDGMTKINEKYKGQFYISSLFPPYNKVFTRPNGGYAKLLGAYDFKEEEYICLGQAGVNGLTEIPYFALSFNEKRNAYCSFYNLDPDWIISAEDVLYSWKQGRFYVHNNKEKRCYFYEQQFYPSLKLVFNKDVLLKKKFMSVAYQSNQIWVSDTNGDINTSTINPQTLLPQISQLKKVDYEIQENIRYAALLYDANSGTDPKIALLEGDYLGGNWIECNFIYKGNEFAWLYAPYIMSKPSNRNF